MRRRRMTIRPSQSMITFSRVGAGIFALVAIGFVAIGVTQVIPSGAGVFGLVWTLMAVCFAGIGIYGACNKKGMYFGYEWQMEEQTLEDGPGTCPGGAEERLKALQALYDQNLITKEEYVQKRQEILKQL